jgi:hypothetical protein
MARPDTRGRQLLLYFDTCEDLERWRKLAEPYPLAKWVRLTIEKAITEKPIRTKSSDEIDALKKKNLELERENEALTARLEKTKARETEVLLEKAKGPMPLDKEVVALLKTGGVWSSTRIIRELTAEKEMAVAEGEDGYRADEIDEGPAFYLMPFSKPVLKLRVRGIKRTLEQLEALDLVKKTWQGWAWKR